MIFFIVRHCEERSNPEPLTPSFLRRQESSVDCGSSPQWR